MSLSIPRYLSESGVQSPEIRYVWDDWNLEQVEEPLDDALVQRLAQMSQRAILAFATGSAEWVVYRFLKLDKEPAPWDFIEAAWAMAIHVRYSGYGKGTGWAEYVTPDEDDGESVPVRWTGPVKGPVSRVLTVLESAIQELAWHGTESPVEYSLYVARGASRIYKLALHVMADESHPYMRWVTSVLQRLEATYPVASGDELGDVVPREALDPGAEFHVDRIEALVTAFLAGANRANAFLSDPAGMLEPIEDDADFPGTPYIFSLEEDRAARHAAVRGHGAGGHRH